MQQSLTPNLLGPLAPHTELDPAIPAMQLVLAQGMEQWLVSDAVRVAQSGLGLTAAQARGIVTGNFLIHTPGLNQPFSSPVAGQWDPRSGSFQTATGQGQSLSDARALLAITPWKHGFTADFYTVDKSMFHSVASILIASCARLGVHLRAHYLQPDTLFTDWNHAGPLARGNFQIALFWYIGTSDPNFLRTNMESRYVDRDQRVHSMLSENDAGIRDSQTDAALERAASTFDSRVRAAAYRAIQLRVNQEAYWLPLHALPELDTRDARVRHFSMNPDAVPWNAYEWDTSP